MDYSSVVLVDPIESKRDKGVVTLKSAFPIRRGSDPISGSPVAIREPIALEYIGAYIKREGYKPTVVMKADLSDQELADSVKSREPFAVGISIHSSYLHSSSLKLAREIKSRIPKAKVILGGYHATSVPELLNEEGIDYIVRKEGEAAFLELINAVKENTDIAKVNGISYIQGGKIVHNPAHERIDFSQSPWALRDSEILKATKAAPLFYPSPPNQTGAAQMSASRGCPYPCDFCPSSDFWERRMTERSPEDVINEMKYLRDEFDVNVIMFNDLTWNLVPRRVQELTDAMIKANLGMKWFAYGAIPNINTDLTERMAKAGCTRMGIGIESVLDPTLKEVKPWQRLDKIRKALEIVDNSGILVRGYMMIGAPWDSKETLSATSDILDTLPIDQVRIAFQIPFPGTRDYDKYKNRIVKPWDNFTGDEPVMPTDHLSIEDLKEAAHNIFKTFYSSTNYRRRVENKVKRFPHLRESFDFFFDYLEMNSHPK